MGFGCRSETDLVGQAEAKNIEEDQVIDLLREEQWARAKTGDPDELARLADREGFFGIFERVDSSLYRTTAIRAFSFVDGFSALPWLSTIAVGEDAYEAQVALQTIVHLAAQQWAGAQEHKEEVREGGVRLLTFVHASGGPNHRRAMAIHALRMFADRGLFSSPALSDELD